MIPALPYLTASAQNLEELLKSVMGNLVSQTGNLGHTAQPITSFHTAVDAATNVSTPVPYIGSEAKHFGSFGLKKSENALDFTPINSAVFIQATGPQGPLFILPGDGFETNASGQVVSRRGRYALSGLSPIPSTSRHAWFTTKGELMSRDAAGIETSLGTVELVRFACPGQLAFKNDAYTVTDGSSPISVQNEPIATENLPEMQPSMVESTVATAQKSLLLRTLFSFISETLKLSNEARDTINKAN